MTYSVVKPKDAPTAGMLAGAMLMTGITAGIGFAYISLAVMLK